MDEALYPGNVIMTADGPRAIDWGSAVRAPAALDLASSHVQLSELAPEVADNPQRPRAVNAAVQAAYARLTGTPEATLAAAAKPYLPIVRLLLFAGVAPALRERLIQRVEAALLAKD